MVGLFLEYIQIIPIVVIVSKQLMTEAQLINQLKFRIGTLQSALSDKSKELDEYRDIQTQADSKIQTMTKMHANKVKSLLNSIQILKKEKALVQNQQKGSNRSNLIQQLNKEILDQDIVIETLRKWIYDEKGKDNGRKLCDDMIVKTLTKGPERIRPETREQLRMEISKLQSVNLNLEEKLKIGGKTKKNDKKDNDGALSQISSISQRSFVNQNQQIYIKLKDLQNQNQNVKLQLNAKGKIIQKLKGDAKEKDKIKAEYELMVNQLEIASRRIQTYERLLKESKQTMNAKIMELYERELKVEELELNTQENTEKLKQAHESTNILIEQMKQEKEQLNIEIELLKKENEGLILQNSTIKKRQEEQKNKIQQIRNLNSDTKAELGNKLKNYQDQIAKIVEENKSMEELCRQLEGKLFKERAEWIEQKSKLIKELEAYEKHGMRGSQQNASMQEINELRQENTNLRQIIESGTGSGSDSKRLLSIISAQQAKIRSLQTKQLSEQQRIYNELYEKYSLLIAQFQNYKQRSPEKAGKRKQKHVVEVTNKEKQQFDQFSSGVSNLGLSDIDSQILDNFDTSYEYSMKLNNIDRKIHKDIPRLTEEDAELLKLINSDLWQFVKDDRIQRKLDDMISINQDMERQNDQELKRKIRQIKNLCHPMGKKLTMYDSQLRDIDNMSESVSITSAIGKEIDKYDSDIDIEVKKNIKGAPKINLRGLNTISDSCSSDMNVSSAKSGDSSFVKRKRGQKASVIKINKDNVSNVSSNSEGYSMNSDVSSININQSQFAGMDSDVSVDFRKKKVNK